MSAEAIQAARAVIQLLRSAGLRNASDDVHPIHLHRHNFEIVKAGNKVMSGIFKDTVRVPRYGTCEVEFVADNPGDSLLHCHMQHHMDYGFKTMVKYA